MDIHTGDIFGRLQVVAPAGFRTYKSGVRRRLFLCKCSCGRTVEVVGSLLASGFVKSCGCWRTDRMRELNRKHGDAGSKLYMVWVDIRRRCEKPNRPSWKYYGGRGVSICANWRDSWPAFKRWALKTGYRDGLTIGRVDNDKGYCPSNCRWETTREQNRNQQRTVWVTSPDGARFSLAEAVERFSSACYNTVRARIRHGWPAWKAVTTPKGGKRNV